MLTVFTLLLLGLTTWAATRIRPARPRVLAATPGQRGALLEGARLRTPHAALVLTARDQARRVTGLGESVQVRPSTSQAGG